MAAKRLEKCVQVTVVKEDDNVWLAASQSKNELAFHFASNVKVCKSRGNKTCSLPLNLLRKQQTGSRPRGFAQCSVLLRGDLHSHLSREKQSHISFRLHGNDCQ